MHPNTTKLTKTWIYGPMQWTWCVRCENIRHDFVAWTLFTNCTSFNSNCTEFCIETKQSQMHPNTKKCNKRWVMGSMRWIGCVCCEKIRRDFVARTFALIAPVQPILHRVSCSNEIVPNAPKHYETYQNMSLGSNGVDQVVRCENYNVNLWYKLIY